MSVDIGKIIVLLEEAIKIKDKITDEIQKEKDAKKRKKLFKAMENHDLDAIRKLLFD